MPQRPKPKPLRPTTPKPRKPASQRRESSLHVRLTAAQRAAIEEKARAATLDASTWVRMVALRETDWRPSDDEGQD